MRRDITVGEIERIEAEMDFWWVVAGIIFTLVMGPILIVYAPDTLCMVIAIYYMAIFIMFLGAAWREAIWRLERCGR